MSFREKLEKKWNITIALLSEARAVLYECQSVGKYIAEYDEYLDHNELELALDMLEVRQRVSLQKRFGQSSRRLRSLWD